MLMGFVCEPRQRRRGGSPLSRVFAILVLVGGPKEEDRKRGISSRVFSLLGSSC